MADDSVKEATLEAADGDEWLMDELGKQAGEHGGPGEGGLSEATWRVFWALDKPLTWWGKIKTATEELWLMTSTDLLLQLNHALWANLDPDGRKGLIAVYLWKASAKTSGKTTQRTEAGDRQLYSVRESSLGLPEEVLANPVYKALIPQIAELKRLQQAFVDPEQLLLDLAGLDDDDPLAFPVRHEGKAEDDDRRDHAATG